MKPDRVFDRSELWREYLGWPEIGLRILQRGVVDERVRPSRGRPRRIIVTGPRVILNSAMMLKLATGSGVGYVDADEVLSLDTRDGDVVLVFSSRRFRSVETRLVVDRVARTGAEVVEVALGGVVPEGRTLLSSAPIIISTLALILNELGVNVLEELEDAYNELGRAVLVLLSEERSPAVDLAAWIAPARFLTSYYTTKTRLVAERLMMSMSLYARAVCVVKHLADAVSYHLSVWEYSVGGKAVITMVVDDDRVDKARLAVVKNALKRLNVEFKVLGSSNPGLKGVLLQSLMMDLIGYNLGLMRRLDPAYATSVNNALQELNQNLARGGVEA